MEELREKISQELPTEVFETSKGNKVIKLSVNTLPKLYNNVYIVFSDNGVFLIDIGFSVNFEGFLRKFDAEITKKYSVKLEEIKGVFVTHAHIDHFGGLSRLKELNPNIKIYVHELDSKTIDRFEETVIYARHYLILFLKRAGLSQEDINFFVSVYSSSREFLKSVKVDRVLRDGDSLYGFKVVYVPGHSPGHICLILDNMIFTGDHILPYITPHQFPESIMRHTGLERYISSLDKVSEVVKKYKIELGLPGHYSAITDVVGRIEEIKAHHRERLKISLDSCVEPITICDLAHKLFPDKRRYQFLLAVEEIGAHIEYLWDRGYLSISNISEFVRDDMTPAKWVKVRDFEGDTF